jgi:hypothetical protein
MTAAHEIDRVVERIKKLLALTASQNPNEAALAASKAQELLFRHNLSMAMVEAATEGGNSAYVADRFDSGGWMHWRRRLLAAVARNNFCRGVSYQGTREVGIVGEPHNVTVVKHLYAFLVHDIIRLADIGVKSEHTLDEEESRAWKRSFYLGAVRTVAQRMAEQRQRDIAADEQSAALVVRKDQELEDAYKEFFPNLAQDADDSEAEAAPSPKDRGPSRPRRADGYRAGMIAGKTIPLNLPLEASRATRRRGRG